MRNLLPLELIHLPSCSVPLKQLIIAQCDLQPYPNTSFHRPPLLTASGTFLSSYPNLLSSWELSIDCHDRLPSDDPNFLFHDTIHQQVTSLPLPDAFERGEDRRQALLPLYNTNPLIESFLLVLPRVVFISLTKS